MLNSVEPLAHVQDMWSIPSGVGGGGKLLYISHITGTHKGCIVLGPFWSENAVINVGHFGLESGLVLEEPTGAYA